MKKLILLLLFSKSIFAQWQKEIDSLFPELTEQPGFVVGVYKEGAIAYKKGFGLANLDYNIPMTSETVIDIASIGKQFTAASIILLQDEGRLSFGDPVAKFIPELPDYSEGEITIDHLLHHTSGLKDYLDLMELGQISRDNAFTEQDVLKIIVRQQNLNFPPGEQYQYSNSGYFLLAELVSRISGKSFGDFVQERILEPLSMKKSLVYNDSKTIIQNRAIGYSKINERIIRNHHYDFAVGGDGQFYTSIEDFFKWDQNFKKNIIGNSSFLDKITTRGILNSGDTIAYVRGLYIKDYKGLQTLEHSGSWGGARSYYLRIPEKDYAVAVFGNYSGVDAVSIGKKVTDIVLDMPEKKKIRIEENLNTKKFIMSEKNLKDFAGYYWNDRWYFSRHIYLKNDTLRFNSDDVRLLPITKNRFKILEEPSTVLEFKQKGGKYEVTVEPQGSDPIFFNQYTKSSNNLNFQNYLGNYYNKALEITYTISKVNDQLHLFVGDKNLGQLNPRKDGELAVDFFGVLKFPGPKSQNNFLLSTPRLNEMEFSSF